MSAVTSQNHQPSRLLRVTAWLSFILNTTIIATGGAVRLTGSGLGCDWPLCAPGSLVPTEEMSYHSLIEFGNRTISAPLLLCALFVAGLSWRRRAQRRDLFTLSLIVVALVLMQALVGGVIVLLHLNANLVGFHYLASLALVCLTAVYLVRLYEPAGARTIAVPRPYLMLTHLTTVAMTVTLIIGVLTTGAGPHSGDANIVRDGFDASLLAHLHAWPGYITLALVVALTGWSAAARLRPTRWNIVLLLALITQVAVGIFQARSGLPPLAVGIHMVLAALTAAAMTVTVLRLKTVRPHAATSNKHSAPAAATKTHSSPTPQRG